MSDSALHPLTRLLLTWYGEHARDLPWRTAPNPYSTWLSEVILQQTRVDQGTAYWHRFLAAFPTVEDLANAEVDEVMRLWKGLGYYSRARNLHQAAQWVVQERGGALPVLAREWVGLPGIGPYTAAAIASICHGEPVPVIDGNVQRVLARLFDIASPVDRKAGKAELEAWSAALIDARDPGSSNQAWMELGALVCLPRAPRCAECPLAGECLALRRSTVAERPVKQPKKAPQAVEVAFQIHIREHPAQGWQWWVERRPSRGIWAQLESFPCSMTVRDRNAGPSSGDQALNRFGPVDHILTHRRMTAWFTVDPSEPAETDAGGRWVDVHSGEANWPRLIEKVLAELRAWIVKI